MKIAFWGSWNHRDISEIGEESPVFYHRGKAEIKAGIPLGRAGISGLSK